MLVDAGDLPLIVALAKQAKASGERYIYFEIVPRGQIFKFVDLWEGAIGEVVGYDYFEDPNRNPGLVQARTVRALKIRAQCIDIIQAGVRAAERLDQDLAKPLRANRVEQARPGVDTQR